MPQCTGSRCDSDVVLATVTREQVPDTATGDLGPAHVGARSLGRLGRRDDLEARRPAAARSVHEAWKERVTLP
ncbi:hypothetical protein GCM10023258_38790 [Terrabacter aeriphilus]|uniref:Uncharacterized protein n=1 Tax=Terrabacter aeriphilus TaxID=515662 RepID=A0ABP9JMI5_9MICO